MKNNKKEHIKSIINKYDYSKQKLLYILHEIQQMSEKNYIKEEWINIIAEEMKVPLSYIYDVITFYSMFEIKARGKYVIEICNNAPCFAKNYEKVVLVLEEILGIKMGETTKDDLFTLQYTSCIGACDIAPVIKIGKEVYGNLDRDKIIKIIDEYKGGVLCQSN